MTSPSPRPGILDISPYVGGQSKLSGVDRVIKLSSNEGALGPSPKAIAAYQATAAEMHRYPDGHATVLRESLARRHGLKVDRIVCGAGSDELLQLLVRGYAGPGDEVLYSRHGFLVYPIAAMASGATPVAADEIELTASVDHLPGGGDAEDPHGFHRQSNNPTGTYLPASEVKRLRESLPGEILLVIDAAYSEFVERNDYSDGTELVETCDNVVMTRTFSKIYGMGGLRLGWAYCPPAIADVLNRIRGPFNVSSAALAAGQAAVEDVDLSSCCAGTTVTGEAGSSPSSIAWAWARCPAWPISSWSGSRKGRDRMRRRPTFSCGPKALSCGPWPPTGFPIACASPSGGMRKCRPWLTP